MLSARKYVAISLRCDARGKDAARAARKHDNLNRKCNANSRTGARRRSASRFGGAATKRDSVCVHTVCACVSACAWAPLTGSTSRNRVRRRWNAENVLNINHCVHRPKIAASKLSQLCAVGQQLQKVWWNLNLDNTALVVSTYCCNDFQVDSKELVFA